MGCCGGKRREVVIGSPGGERGATVEVPETVAFVYEGRTSMTIIGPITRSRYRFGSPGAKVSIDARDAPFLAGVPHVRRSSE